MKKIVALLILCLVPSLVSAVDLEGEEKVLNALEAIRTALDTGVTEPVDETMAKLLSDAKAAIEAYKASKKPDELFIEDAEKSLDYFQNISRTLKMGFPPFEADRKQADKWLDEAQKIHRENVRAASGS
jgi:type II secretory pathway pseudopilin PulG